MAKSKKRKPVKKVKRSKASQKVKKLSEKELQALLPDLDLRVVPLKKLKRWKVNPRENEHAAPQLAQVIKEHGFRVPIITTQDYRIWAGDTRYQAAQLLGMTKVPVIVTEFEEQARAMMFALAENKSSEWARWDPDKLQDVFQQRANVDISDLQRMSGFSAIDIQRLRGTGDLPDMPEGFGDGELANPLDPTELEGANDAWYRIVITCKDDSEKKRLHKLLGIGGKKAKKTVFTLADLKVQGHRKPVKKRKIRG